MTHQASCSYAPFKCVHVSRGCEFSGTKKNQKKHLSICPYEILKGAFDSIESRFMLLEQKIAAQSKEIALLKSVSRGRGNSNFVQEISSTNSQRKVPTESVSMIQSKSLINFDFDQFECVGSIPHAHHSGVTALCPHLSLSGGKRILYSGSHDARLKIWDEKNLSLLGDVEAHKYTIWALSFINDRLLSASADGSIKSWDPETFQRNNIKNTPLGHEEGKIYCMTGVGNKSNLVASGSSDRYLKLI